MSERHPIIAITGSSGAGTTSVTRTFENIFRREGVNAAIIEGGGFGWVEPQGRTALERHFRGVGMTPPFTLTLWQNGTLSLVDKATGRAIELGSFGPDNRAAFAALMPGGAG